MTRGFGYETPEDPQEEAEIFGLVGPGELTKSPDTERAENEANLIGSHDYDDHQELFDESARTEFELEGNIVAHLFGLSEAQRSDVLTFIQTLLDDQEGDENSST